MYIYIYTYIYYITSCITMRSHFGPRSAKQVGHMDDAESCYFRQPGGRMLACSAPGCTRTDPGGKVKKMMGDTQLGRLYCPFHWRLACWRDFHRQCLCSRGCADLAQEAPQGQAAGPSAPPAPHVPGLAHPTYKVSCSRVLQRASRR